MEKKVGTTKASVIRVILTGPESTGKTEIASKLADKYNSIYIPEYAREYIENLNRPYDYSDVEHIAKHQVKQMKEYSSGETKLLFVDTYLIITKVWFKWVYNKFPSWLEDEIFKTRNDLYLLCKPDIAWFPDKVRENGGEMRNILFDIYDKELKKFSMHYRHVSGMGDERFSNAARHVEDFLLEKGLKI
jgi:nicotinamide riboside kinase